MTYIEKIFLDYQIENDRNRAPKNKGKPWSDSELKLILLDSPTKYNALKYAKIFDRGYGSIEQIYRWAATSKKDIKEKRSDDSFIQQIYRVSKEIGMRI